MSSQCGSPIVSWDTRLGAVLACQTGPWGNGPWTTGVRNTTHHMVWEGREESEEKKTGTGMVRYTGSMEMGRESPHPRAPALPFPVRPSYWPILRAGSFQKMLSTTCLSVRGVPLRKVGALCIHMVSQSGVRLSGWSENKAAARSCLCRPQGREQEKDGPLEKMGRLHPPGRQKQPPSARDSTSRDAARMVQMSRAQGRVLSSARRVDQSVGGIGSPTAWTGGKKERDHFFHTTPRTPQYT